MQETMGELIATPLRKLRERLADELTAEPDAATCKRAVIAALSVLLGEPRDAGPKDGD